MPTIKPEQRAAIWATLLIFWPVVLIWIFLDPPGTGSASFCELTILMGTATIIASNIQPIRSIRDFAGGILLSLVVFFFVHPWIPSWFWLAGLQQGLFL